MLIEFAFTNFRSFHERQVFSLLPAKGVKYRNVMPIPSVKYPKVQILPSAVVYGANNAGKSNLLKGISALKDLVCNSGQFNSDKKLGENDFFCLDINAKINLQYSKLILLLKTKNVINMKLVLIINVF